MPPKTDLWKTNLIGAIWLNNALKDHRPNSKDRMPTSTELKNELDDEAWDQLFPDASHPRPRDRTIQSVQQKFKHLYSTFLEDIQERVVKPLGDGWPRGGDDLAYMLALQRLWSRQARNRLGLTGATAELWTREEVDVALELKTALGWPNGFDEFAGPAHRKSWQLQHPYAAREIPGEIAIIKELALRRVCSQGGVEGFEGNSHNDIYEILMDRPWDANHSRTTHHYGDVRFTRPVWATMLWEGLGNTSVVGISNAIRVLWRNHLEMWSSLIGAHGDDESDLQLAKMYILDLLEQAEEVRRITSDLCPPLELMSRSPADESTPGIFKTPFQTAMGALPIKHTWSIAFQADQMLTWAFKHLGIPTDLSPEAVHAVNDCSGLNRILPMPDCEHPDDFQAVADERGVDVLDIGEDGGLTNLAFDRAWNRHEQGYGLWCEACQSRSFEDNKFSLWV